MPAGDERIVRSILVPQYGFVYMPDPPPPPPPPPPPTGAGATEFWVDSVDVTDPSSITTTLRYYSSCLECDIDDVTMTIGGVSTGVPITGSIPYRFTMGRINLANIPTDSSTTIAFNATGPCDSASASYTISRPTATTSATSSVTVTFFDNVAPTFNNYSRTFSQTYVTTTISAPITWIGAARCQLTSARDAIVMGPTFRWPGPPAVTDMWTATGATDTASSVLQLEGYQNFDQTLSFIRPQGAFAVFGNSPTATVDFTQFGYFTGSGQAAATAIPGSLSVTTP
jgi:hypothetical protein